MATAGITLPHDWFPAPLPANVRLGAATWLYSAYAFLHYQSLEAEGVTVGHDTGIYNGTFFDLGPRGSVRIGNYCSIVGAIFASNGHVDIGDHVFIAHEVVIAASAFATPPQVRTASCTMQAATMARDPDIVIGANAWLGMRAVLLAGAKIGDGAIVGAGAVVNFEVPPYAIVAGNPARIVGSVAARANGLSA
jgi:acetyltransferase-like isoleucine patch superfamily enzyme